MTHKLAAGSSQDSFSGFRGAIRSAWRARPAVRRVTLVAALGLYAFLSLEPFDWQVPRQQANHAERLPEGWRFPAAGIVIAEPPHPWLEAAQHAETIGVTLLVRPLATAQSGPARILTMSRDAHLRNLTIGQEDDDLVVRLRTEETDLNGLRAGEPVARLQNVFRSGSWVSVDLQIRPRELTIAVEGERAFIAELPGSVLGSWHAFLGLALGNETTCDRPWLGEIKEAVITVAGGSTDYARRDDVDVPATCWVIGYPPAMVPFRLFLPQDAILNVLMYLPLGCLLGCLIRSRTHRAFAGGLLAVVAVSAAFEVAQLFVASRFTSIDDTICNTIGGGIGLGLAWWLTGGATGRRDPDTDPASPDLRDRHRARGCEPGIRCRQRADPGA
ncbi:MAG: VanZ family protein [Geminicoccaceae bacterium]